MQHKISECRTGIRATKSPALELYLAESKYTNLATKKSNDNRCTHALAAVSDVAMNSLTSVTNFVTKGAERSFSTALAASNACAEANDAPAAHR